MATQGSECHSDLSMKIIILHAITKIEFQGKALLFGPYNNAMIAKAKPGTKRINCQIKV